MKNILQTTLLLWAVVSLAYFNWQSIFRIHSFLIILPDVTLLLVGIPFWLHRDIVKKKIHTHKLDSIKKFFLLAYGMMLFEKMIAVLAQELDEEFSLSIFLLHVAESWLFNIFVFTGVIIGLYIILRKGVLSVRESLPLIGFLALFIEKVLPFLFANPRVFLMLAPATVLECFLIFIPAMYALGTLPHVTHDPWRKRFLLATGIIFLCSLPPVFVLGKLSLYFPEIFPTI